MADSGPTTVGSIVGKLRMDFDQWLVGKAKVKEDAREIGALRPTVKVDANVAEAIAKLDGAVAATDRVVKARARLDVAERQAANAASTAYVANQRLEAVMDKRGRTELQVTAATEALARADRNAEAAEVRLIAANEALAVAEREAAEEAAKLAAAQVANAGAQDTAAAATVRANEANKTSVTRMGLIVTAVATLIPLLIPVAGIAVGIAGALTMMGAAGVLAVFGIKNEMADGSRVGNEYRRGLGGLKKDMDELSRTSAVNMLSSFNRVVGETNAAMPMLNRQVGYFSGLLGRSGGNLFSGSIAGLRVLEPLLLTVGVYLEGLTRKFQNWTGNGGLQAFGNWALSVLPQVEQLLASLGTAVFHLLEALAPLGMVGVAVLTGIADAINAIPADVLGPLIGAVIWGTLAFKAWGFIAPMLASIATQMGAVGVASTIATGPIGWVVAGVAGLAAILTVATVSTRNAAAAVATYTSAVQADTGAIGENVRAAAAKALLDEGAFTRATKLGISAKTLTDAVLGNAAAQREVNSVIDHATGLYGEVTEKGGRLTKSQQETAIAAGVLKGMLETQSGGIKGAVADYKILQEALGQTDSDQSTTGQQIADTTAKLRAQNDVTNILRQSFDLLNGVSLDVYSAQTSLASSNNSLIDSFKQNGTVVDGNTKAAVANQRALQSQVSAAQQVAEAIARQTGSSEKAVESYKASKTAIEDQLRAQGDLTPAVQAYIDKLYDIANLKVPPTKLDIDAARALELLTTLKSLLDNIRKPVSISVTGGPTIGHGTQAFAGGGTVRGEGGPKGDKVWVKASPGEEFIQEPQASKYRSVLKAINADNFNLAGFAQPAGTVKGAPLVSPTAAPPGPAVSGSRSIVNHWNIRQNASPTAVAHEVQRRQNALAAA